MFSDDIETTMLGKNDKIFMRKEEASMAITEAITQEALGIQDTSVAHVNSSVCSKGNFA